LTKAFSVASWNVKHFKSIQARKDLAVSFLKTQDADIFALYELYGKDVFTEVLKQFPGYTFQITEGRRSQEILLGIRNSLDAFITQKLEYTSGTTHVSPGLLATIMHDGSVYPMLFMNIDSSPTTQGMGLRYEMMQRAFKYRSRLDKLAWEQGDAKVNYIFLGDMEIMGMNHPFGKSIDAETELKKWDEEECKKYNMRRLMKTHSPTFRACDGSYEGDYDQVYVAEHLKFAKSGEAEVDVRGWITEPEDKQKEWREKYSPHSLLYFEVHKP
jgi:exonuclease III